MRYLFGLMAAGLATTLLWAAQGSGKVEVKGAHICCPQCVNIAKKLLSKVEGVSEANADAKTKTITFEAKDEAAVTAGLKAITDGGFYGKATQGEKKLKLNVAAAKKGEKADTVTIKDVHVCCGACKKAINAEFKDAKVSYEGKGAQLTVKVEGTGLDKGEVLQTLRKAGFNGTLE